MIGILTSAFLFSLQISEDWQYIAMVLDRVFLIAFTLACVLGSASIIFEAPSLFDDKVPIDVLLSKVAPRVSSSGYISFGCASSSRIAELEVEYKISD